jgi:hypothetical protein
MAEYVNSVIAFIGIARTYLDRRAAQAEAPNQQLRVLPENAECKWLWSWRLRTTPKATVPLACRNPEREVG